MAKKIKVLEVGGDLLEFPFPEYVLMGKREEVDGNIAIFVDYESKGQGWLFCFCLD